MRSIQEVGTEILGNTPSSLYIFCGQEYGIKEKYLHSLESFYNEKIEADSFLELMNTMNTRHMIPLQPTLYVVRYDEVFLSKLDDKLANKIRSCKIIGTIVCIYESQKASTKFDKYLPDYTCSIPSVSPKFLAKYLLTDYPRIPTDVLNHLLKKTVDYSRLSRICASLSLLSDNQLHQLNESDIEELTGCSSESTEADLRCYIASRDFYRLVHAIDKYPESKDKIIYTILQTMIELDKVKDSKYVESDVRKYEKLWTRADIYYMFMHAYRELNKLRTYTSFQAENSLIYLFSLLKYRNIPDLEVLN